MQDLTNKKVLLLSETIKDDINNLIEKLAELLKKILIILKNEKVITEYVVNLVGNIIDAFVSTAKIVLSLYL